MKHIEINLGKACNNRCRFCMSNEFAFFIDFEKAKEEVIKNAKKGYNSIGFLGGEVTLHPNFIDIVKIAKQNGYEKIHLISNGRKFADKDFLCKIIDAGVNRFSVSIHSHNEKIEDYLTQINGGYKQKIRGIINLVEAKKTGLFLDDISINIVINKKNYQSIIQSIYFFKNIGVTNYRLNYIFPHGNALNYYNDLKISYTDFYPYIKNIIKFSGKNKLHVVFDGIPFCVMPNLYENQKYIGELLDVPTNVINYNKDNRTEFSWQQKKKQKLKLRRMQCRKCDYYKLCEGVWAKYIEFYGWNEFNTIKNGE